MGKRKTKKSNQKPNKVKGTNNTENRAKKNDNQTNTVVSEVPCDELASSSNNQQVNINGVPVDVPALILLDTLLTNLDITDTSDTETASSSGLNRTASDDGDASVDLYEEKDEALSLNMMKIPQFRADLVSSLEESDRECEPTRSSTNSDGVNSNNVRPQTSTGVETSKEIRERDKLIHDILSPSKESSKPVGNDKSPKKTTKQNKSKVESESPKETTKQNKPKVESESPKKTTKQNKSKVESESPKETTKQNKPKVESESPEETTKQNKPKVESENPKKTTKQNKSKVESESPKTTTKQNKSKVEPESTKKTTKQNKPKVESESPKETTKQNKPKVESKSPKKTTKQNKSKVESESTKKTTKQNQSKVESESTKKTKKQNKPKLESNEGQIDNSETQIQRLLSEQATSFFNAQVDRIGVIEETILKSTRELPSRDTTDNQFNELPIVVQTGESRVPYITDPRHFMGPRDRAIPFRPILTRERIFNEEVDPSVLEDYKLNCIDAYTRPEHGYVSLLPESEYLEQMKDSFNYTYSSVHLYTDTYCAKENKSKYCPGRNSKIEKKFRKETFE